ETFRLDSHMVRRNASRAKHAQHGAQSLTDDLRATRASFAGLTGGSSDQLCPFGEIDPPIKSADDVGRVAGVARPA
ncbi:MAG: hypothetical protein AAGL49_12160, partial [Pseudomonadota bacterium]